MLKELSLFVDESGDFGEYDHHAPYYIIGLIVHDQKIDISKEIETFRKVLEPLNLANDCIHVGPLIRREGKHASDDARLARNLAKQIEIFISQNYEYFLDFDVVKIYYDNGQIAVTRILKRVFKKMLSNVDFRKITQSDYRLAQVADLVCTAALLELKMHDKTISRSERRILGTDHEIEKRILKPLRKHEMD